MYKIHYSNRIPRRRKKYFLSLHWNDMVNQDCKSVIDYKIMNKYDLNNKRGDDYNDDATFKSLSESLSVFLGRVVAGSNKGSHRWMNVVFSIVLTMKWWRKLCSQLLYIYYNRAYTCMVTYICCNFSIGKWHRDE